MAPQVAALAQSESKSKFFQRLGLKPDQDRGLYALMKSEAAEGRKRLLREVEQDAPINETAMHRTILQIYRQASPRTKAVYDLGRDTDGVEEENWVIRWLLWHAFRYRDSRNNRKSKPASQLPVSEDESEVSSSVDLTERSPEVAAQSNGVAQDSIREALQRPSRRFDPVRDTWQTS